MSSLNEYVDLTEDENEPAANNMGGRWRRIIVTPDAIGSAAMAINGEIELLGNEIVAAWQARKISESWRKYWAIFVRNWREFFAKYKDSWSGAIYDQVQDYADKLDGWRKQFAKATGSEPISPGGRQEEKGKRFDWNKAAWFAGGLAALWAAVRITQSYTHAKREGRRMAEVTAQYLPPPSPY